MSASTLPPRTESYLHEVARRLPPRAREDVSRELRGTVADMVDDGVAQDSRKTYWEIRRRSRLDQSMAGRRCSSGT